MWNLSWNKIFPVRFIVAWQNPVSSFHWLETRWHRSRLVQKYHNYKTKFVHKKINQFVFILQWKPSVFIFHIDHWLSAIDIDTMSSVCTYQNSFNIQSENGRYRQNISHICMPAYFNDLVQAHFIKESGGLSHFYEPKPPLLMQSCKCFPHVSKILIFAYNWDVDTTVLILIISYNIFDSLLHKRWHLL